MTSGCHATSRASTPGRAEVFEGVQQIVAERAGCPAERIRDSDRLEQDLGLDSLDQVEIVMEVEEEFELNVPDEIANNVRTVGHIVDGVVALLQSPAVS
jgi:acyl carrier protein